MNVSEYMLFWLEGKKADLQRSTVEAYTIYITRHINPFFDHLGKNLEDLRPIDIKSYVTEKRNGGRMDHRTGGLSAVSVRKHLNIIKQAFREAVLIEIIPASPAEPIKLPRAQTISSQAKFISINEARRILAAFERHSLYPLVYTTLLYGLRRSEALGLKKSAVDFENQSITIRHTVVKNLTIEAKDRTKNDSSFRTYPLLQEIKILLMPILEKRSNNDYIFAKSNGYPLRPDSVTRTFQRVLKAHGIEKMRFHDLRHATASILFDKGWSVPDVQHWLGHANIETTMNIYVKYNCTRKLTVGGALEDLFSDKSKS